MICIQGKPTVRCEEPQAGASSDILVCVQYMPGCECVYLFVFLCVYICVHVLMCLCINVYMFWCAYVLFVCLCLCMFLFVCRYKHLFLCFCLCLYEYILLHVFVFIFVCMYLLVCVEKFSNILPIYSYGEEALYSWGSASYLCISIM